MILPRLEVAAADCNEVVVGVPVDAQDGGTERLLDVFAYPPGRGERGEGRGERGEGRGERGER